MRLPNTITFTGNNQLTLLSCGAEFFPALIATIDSAVVDIYLETYLFSPDITGMLVHDALCRAAQRGVQVYVMVDWLGTGHRHTQELERSFTACGVHFRSFNPWFKRGFARTHRKLVVVDNRVAIVGGININHDLYAEGENRHVFVYPRWDFAVTVQGPLVADIHRFSSEQWQKAGHLDWRARLELLTKKRTPSKMLRVPVVAGLALHDNLRYRRTIHKTYLKAIATAKSRILIATPYFAPGRKFRRALINARKRGVEVTLLVGRGEFKLQDAVTQSYYPRLLRYGIRVVEYHKSALHAKVAVIDDAWCTVGSCNCDGLSLFVNHEANLIIKDSSFSEKLADALLLGVADGVPVQASNYQNLSWWRKFWYKCAVITYSLIMRVIAVEDFV